MKLFQLTPNGLINLDRITEVRPYNNQDLPEYTHRVHFGGDSSLIRKDIANNLLATLNAPVQIAQFVGRGNYQEEATDEANSGANEFLMDLQPWQFINIASQMVYEQPTDTSDECYTHIITLTYRLYRPKTVNTEEAA